MAVCERETDDSGPIEPRTLDDGFALVGAVVDTAVWLRCRRAAIALSYVPQRAAPAIGPPVRTTIASDAASTAGSRAPGKPPQRWPRVSREAPGPLYFAFAGLRLGCNIVPVHCFAPQRHSQIFFRRAVWASARVMP